MDDEDNGFITLHRKLMKWEWYTAPHHTHLFTFFLLKANHKEGSWRGVKINRGELLTSLSKIAKETGLTLQNVRTIIKNFKKSGEINMIPNTKYTHISICKYDSYQKKKPSLNMPPNTELTQSQHGANTELTTNNNDNNNKQQETIERIRAIEFIDYDLFIAFLDVRKKLGVNESVIDKSVAIILNLLIDNKRIANDVLERCISSNSKNIQWAITELSKPQGSARP